MGEIRVVRAQGMPLARGQQVGRELSDLIQRSIDFYHRYLTKRGVTSESLQDLLFPYLVAAEQQYPDAMAVLKGMSVGAMVPVLELFAINAFEELEPLLESPEGELRFLQKKAGYVKKEGYVAKPERCSSLTVRTPDGLLFAHNEHWLAGDSGNVAVVIDEPGGGRAPVASATVVCCLPAVGINGHGAVQGIGSLAASDDGVGVPRVFVSRSTLEAHDRSDAISRATVETRAGGYGFVMGFPDGDAFAIETTGARHRVFDGAGPHTNHYLDEDLASLAPEASVGSEGRLTRLRQLLEERRPQSPPELMDIMRDHGSSPQSICLHPDLAEGEESSAVMFSVVCDVTARRMWVAPGNPCEHVYEEIDLRGVAV